MSVANRILAAILWVSIISGIVIVLAAGFINLAFFSGYLGTFTNFMQLLEAVALIVAALLIGVPLALMFFLEMCL